MRYNSYQLYIEVMKMFQPTSATAKELREELLGLAEALQGDILLLECLARADLSDCCQPSALEPLYRRLCDYTHQHGRDIGRLTEKLS